MSASSAVSQSAGRRTGPVVAAITDRTDLPLVLVAAAQAKRRGAELVLVHCAVSRGLWTITAGAATRGGDPDAALRDRALTLAKLSDVDVTWVRAVGRSDRVVARYCRDNRATLIVVGASRSQLTTWRLRTVLSAARQLKRRAHTPIHIIAT